MLGIGRLCTMNAVLSGRAIKRLRDLSYSRNAEVLVSTTSSFALHPSTVWSNKEPWWWVWDKRVIKDIRQTYCDEPGEFHSLWCLGMEFHRFDEWCRGPERHRLQLRPSAQNTTSGHLGQRVFVVWFICGLLWFLKETCLFWIEIGISEELCHYTDALMTWH